MKKVFDDLIIINLYHNGLKLFNREHTRSGGDGRGVAGVVGVSTYLSTYLDTIPSGLSEAEAVCRNLR